MDIFNVVFMLILQMVYTFICVTISFHYECTQIYLNVLGNCIISHDQLSCDYTWMQSNHDILLSVNSLGNSFHYQAVL